MPIKISGVDVAKVLVGSAPASRIISGGVVVWQAIRKITISATYAASAQQYRWNVSTASGSTEIIDPVTSGNQSVLISFPVPMTCSRTVNRGVGTIDAGVVIPAGVNVGARTTQSHVFTEVTS